MNEMFKKAGVLHFYKIVEFNSLRLDCTNSLLIKVMVSVIYILEYGMIFQQMS